ncbi:phage tail length tape measure family protein [Escherichia coli]
MSHSAALVNAGVRGGEQFDAINQSVARFASVSGVEVDKVAEAFGKLTTDPTSERRRWRASSVT